MKDRTNVIRSRNARLNLARRSAVLLVDLLDPEKRPKDKDVEGWSLLLAEIKDRAQDVAQAAYEASAYNNVLIGGVECTTTEDSKTTKE